MKILALTSRWPEPARGGDRLRFFALCREMSKRHRLTLLALCETRAEMTAALPGDGVFADAHRVFLPRWRSWLNCAAALPGRQPLQVAYYRSAEFRAKVAELLPAHDVAFAHLIRVAEYVADARAGRPAVLDMTDAISMNYTRVAAVGGAQPRHPRVPLSGGGGGDGDRDGDDIHPRHPRSPRLKHCGGDEIGGGMRGLIYRIELPRLLRYEREIAARFEAAVLCSPVDRDFLFAPPAPGNILVCGNGVDFERVKFSPPPESAPLPSPSPAGITVFIGNMRTLQNRDAAWWFCRRILPVLRRQNAAWEFKIIGPIATRERAKFNRQPGVVATGKVEDVAATVRALHSDSDGDIHPRHPRVLLSGGGDGDSHGAAPARVLIGVCPMRAGAGVQNKILDCMAMGLPCVTTAIGAEGLRARPGEELLVADSAQEFAATVARLAADRTFARQLAINARRYVETAHSWSANLAPLMARLEGFTVLTRSKQEIPDRRKT